MNVVFVLAVWFAAAASPTKESLYYTSVQQLQKKQYRQAALTLKRLHKVLVQEQRKSTKNTKRWHLLTIGQSDALERLAGVVWQLGRTQQACLYHQSVEQNRKSLPVDWQTWTINAAVRKRLLASKAFLLSKCAAIPSFVSVKVTPGTARVSLQKAGAWVVVKAKRFEVFREKISLKVEAPEHTTKTLRDVAIPRWRSKVLEVALKPLPRKVIVVVVPDRRVPRAVPRRLPPPTPKPVFQKWWFWTIIGVGVAGGVAAVVAGVVVSADVEHSFKGREGETYFKVW